MRCATCRFVNPEGRKVCNECGAPLKGRCASAALRMPRRPSFAGSVALCSPGGRQFPSPKLSLPPADTQCQLSEEKGCASYILMP
jgi:hypothetical protein